MKNWSDGPWHVLSTCVFAIGLGRTGWVLLWQQAFALDAGCIRNSNSNVMILLQ